MRHQPALIALLAGALLTGCAEKPRYGSPAQLAASLDCDHKAVYDGTAGDEDDGVALGTCEQYEGTQLVLLVADDEQTRQAYVTQALADARGTAQPLTALEGPRWAAFAPDPKALEAARAVLGGDLR